MVSWYWSVVYGKDDEMYGSNDTVYGSDDTVYGSDDTGTELCLSHTLTQWLVNSANT